jgi:D-tyrosyl-tRNA(Tyr) deacylase
MRAVVQRVKRAKVEVEGKVISEIQTGILTLLGIAKGDDEENLGKTIKKICGLRIFEDEEGKLNRSAGEVGGEHLIVSQFTLLGNCNKGRRPSFEDAAHPEEAKRLYELALKLSLEEGLPSRGGQFGADMQVSLQNDGPVTLIVEF